ncbi:MAG: phosphate ABC transporter permease PstA [Chloroflexota bacterium]|nr:phosphate ABC transporter permease PstA [Chloroflexota bacterium]MDQ2940646.1 phosphate ABC transporter permease PstA [Chloroflexota bacterium]
MASIGRPQQVTTTELVERRLRSATVDWRGYLLQGLLLMSLLLALAVLAVLLGDIIIKAIPVFVERPLEFLTGQLSARPQRAGISQGIIGSLLLMGFVVVLAIPLGIAAAVYLEEYAHDTRTTRFINTNIRNLAGVPAIVFGLLGLAVFVTLLRLGNTLTAGGLTLAVLVLPIVVITTSEALRAVPVSIREAALAVGATRWETVRSHVLPYAAPGIMTGSILSLARAFGETAPLLLVGAVAGTFSSSGSILSQLFGSYTALPTIVYNFARESKAEFRALTAATIVVLLVVILLVNATAIILRNRYDRRW